MYERVICFCGSPSPDISRCCILLPLSLFFLHDVSNMLSMKPLPALCLRDRHVASPPLLSSSSSHRSSFTTAVFIARRTPFPWSCCCYVAPLVAMLGMWAVVRVCAAVEVSTPTIL
ncbi:uncharacterized protein DS421_3g81550 [Arachis hypogaea]|nr:uncharacterized protein DS421_3g81550 [Arachis hypogaea]